MAQVHDVKSKKVSARRERESDGFGFFSFLDFFHLFDLMDLLFNAIRWLLKPLKIWS